MTDHVHLIRGDGAHSIAHVRIAECDNFKDFISYHLNHQNRKRLSKGIAPGGGKEKEIDSPAATCFEAISPNLLAAVCTIWPPWEYPDMTILVAGHCVMAYVVGVN